MRKIAFLILALVCAAIPARAQQLIPIVGGVVTANVSGGQNSFKVTVNATITSVVFTNPSPGQVITVLFQENSTGGFTVTFGGNITNACTVATGANANTACTFQYDAGTNTWIGAGGSSSGSGGSAATVIDAASSIYGIKHDVRQVVDATTTSSSPNISSATANFTSADVGKEVGVWANCGTTLVDNGVSQVAAGVTIQTVTDSSHAVLSGNVTTGGTNQCVALGTNDDAGWDLVDTAIANSTQCPTVVLPVGLSAIDRPHLFNQPNSCANLPTVVGGSAGGGSEEVKGQGQVTSGFWLTKKFLSNLATNCTRSGSGKACFRVPAGTRWHDWGMTGFGESGTGTSATVNLVEMEAYSTIQFMSFANFALNATGVDGLVFNNTLGSGPGYIKATEVDGFGIIDIANTNTGILYVLDGSNIQDSNTQLTNSGGGKLYIRDSLIGTGNGHGGDQILQSNGGVLNLDDVYFYVQNNIATHDINFASGSGYINNSLLNTTSGSSTNSNNVALLLGASGVTASVRDSQLGAASTFALFANASITPTYNDLGGNTLTGTVTTNGSVTFQGPNVLTGVATGTLTASSTLGFYGLGQLAGPAGTSTTVANGSVMDRAGTIIGIQVVAGTGGVNASSGVVSILKNGSATSAPTCTLGTTTTCNDFTHPLAYSADDVISAQITTQAAETLANVKIKVLRN